MSAVAYRSNGHISRRAAEELGATIERLVQHGCVTPRTLVEEARSPESSIHKYFEWDDAKASEQYRLIQARLYLRSVTVEYVTPDVEAIRIRAFVPVYVDGHGRSWKPLREVVEVPAEMKQVLETARAELLTFRKKYNLLRRMEQGAQLLRSVDDFLAAEE
jgi:hypothetical protein